ncbi:MAG: DUF2194 domain-containing protein [Peptostreptococcales bacterium]
MLSKRIYFSILLLLLIMFIMFLLPHYGQYLSKHYNLQNEKIDIRRHETIDEKYLDMQYGSPLIEGKTAVAIVNQLDSFTRPLTEFCVYNKYAYKVFDSLPSLDIMKDFDILILGEIDYDMERLTEYSHFGITMFFTKLPDYDFIDSSDAIANFFGIDSAVENDYPIDGFKIYPDFLIGYGRSYGKGDYFGDEDDTELIVPYYSLLPGYEIYSVGILENQEELSIENIDLPPLLWKTRTHNSFVFIINSDIFMESSLLGILTGFNTREKEFHLYPIVNAQTISLLNYPYFSYEQEDEMKNIYARDTKALTRNLLFPNIVKILNHYGDSNNFFFSPQLDYSKIRYDGGDIDFYIRQINKLSGNIGLSFSQQSHESIYRLLAINRLFYNQYLPDYSFNNLYLGGFSKEEFYKIADDHLLKDLSLVLSDYNPDENLLYFLDEDILSIGFNKNGYKHETLDDLRMLSIENALGMCNVSVDLSQVYYPETPSIQWHNLSLDWSKGKTYFNDFAVFDFVSINELERRVRRFLKLDYTYEVQDDHLNLSIKNFDEKAFFIFSIYDKSIEKIENGEIKQISKDYYLIKANDENVVIHFKDRSILDQPKNDRVIPLN